MSTLQNFLGAALKPVILYMSRGRLPQIDGRLRLPGLNEEVTIQRDKWGIPHISAATRPGLFFAQGFTHAQERLWQMDLNRRAANGQFAALVGPIALDTDRLTRTLGFRRLAPQVWALLSHSVKADLTAYAAGVNAYLDGDYPLPVEFSLLRQRPGRWDPLDSVAYSLLQGWALSHGWSSELLRAQLAESISPELLAEISPEYTPRNPTTLPQGIEFNQLRLDGMLETMRGPFLGKGALDGGGRGSNGWVIAPSRSATGHAILCNDMHLPVSSPGLWYFVHQRTSDGLHVAGVTQPGLPYVLVGHNDHIAWGATLAFTDTEDLFIEQLDDTGQRYRFGDEWRPLTLVEESIEVKGAAEHLETVRLTHHGPIVSPALSHQLPGSPQLALQSVALQPSTAFEGFALLNQAAGWDDFVRAVRHIDAPTLNIVYADTSDNIGYWVTGRVPIRAQGDGLTPAPGYSASHEWIDFVPFEAMPHALNPARGYLITCNHRIIGDDYPYYLGALWMNGYRARRLEELFSAQPTISLDDCRRFQFDFHSVPGRELVDLLANFTPDDADAALSLQLLREWDGWFGPESVGGAVYKLLITRLAHVILGNGLGPELAQKYLGTGEHPILLPTNEFFGHWPVTLMRLLQNPASGWLPGRVGRDAILTRCLAETTAELRQRLGANPRHWQWGHLHRVPFAHTLGSQPPLDLIFNQGPFPIGGDTDTVLQTAIRPEAPYDNNNFSPSYRQIIDLGHLGGSVAMHAPGQSGHVGSPQYGDLIEPWLTGNYYPITWEPEAVADAARHTLTLSAILDT